MAVARSLHHLRQPGGHDRGHRRSPAAPSREAAFPHRPGDDPLQARPLRIDPAGRSQPLALPGPHPGPRDRAPTRGQGRDDGSEEGSRPVVSRRDRPGLRFPSRTAGSAVRPGTAHSAVFERPCGISGPPCSLAAGCHRHGRPGGPWPALGAHRNGHERRLRSQARGRPRAEVEVSGPRAHPSARRRHRENARIRGREVPRCPRLQGHGPFRRGTYAGYGQWAAWTSGNCRSP